MAKQITLTNIFGNGKGRPSGTSNINLSAKQSFADNPGNGAPESLKLTPAAAGECGVRTAAKYHIDNSHLYYFTCWVKYSGDANCTFDLYWPEAEPAALAGMRANATAGVWTKISGIFNRSQFASNDYNYRFDYNNEAENVPVYIASMMLFDLTATFGAGIEPAKEWMDDHITQFADSQTTTSFYDNLGDLFTDIASAVRLAKGYSSSRKIYPGDIPSLFQ